MGVIRQKTTTIVKEKIAPVTEKYDGPSPDGYVTVGVFAGCPYWNDGWGEKTTTTLMASGVATCGYCGDSRDSKPAKDWDSTSVGPNGLAGVHTSCALANFGIRLTANNGVFTGRQSDDGNVLCDTFRRKERRRGRVPPDALCECGETRKNHAGFTGRDSDDDQNDEEYPLEIINQPTTKETEVEEMATKTKNVKLGDKAPKASRGEKAGKVIKMSVGQVTVIAPIPMTTEKAPKAPKAIQKPAVIEAKPLALPVVVTAPIVQKAPNTSTVAPTRPPTREELLAAVKAAPKVLHRFLGAGRGKPAITAVCVGCGSMWSDNVHDKSPRN